MSEPSIFTWQPIYEEIGRRLVGMSDRQAELLAILRRAQAAGVPTSRLTDRNAEGESFPLAEIDPLTFMGNYNRPITDQNRTSILRTIRDAWDLQSPLPSDFFGLPVMNLQSSWMMPYAGKRADDHVATLWQFYDHVQPLDDPQTLDTDLFDRCLALPFVGMAYLTMGLFWARPEVWSSTDRKNLAAAKNLGVQVDPKDGQSYLRWLGQVRDRCESDPLKFSRQAHLDSQAPAVVSPKDLGGSRRYWIIAPGEQASYWNVWQDEGCARLGWAEVGDLSRFNDRDQYDQHLREVYPSLKTTQVGRGWILWNFANEVSVGDVMIAKQGVSQIVGWGEVTGTYQYDPWRDGDDELPHHIDVAWKSAKAQPWIDGQTLPIQSFTEAKPSESFTVWAGEHCPGMIDGEVTDPTPEPYDKATAMAGLFLPETEFDRIIALLRRKRNVILQGAPGTGKTFIAERLAYYLMGVEDSSRKRMTQFHQSTSYEDFIEGYRPGSSGSFERVAGTFQTFCKAAKLQPGKPFVMVIDEINRGNLSKIFGELMMLIESDKRHPRYAMPLTYSNAEDGRDEDFYVPDNVYLIGTMNTADRSLSVVDYALRRRFAFINLRPQFDSGKFRDHLIAKGVDAPMINWIQTKMRTLNEGIESDFNLGPGYRIGHSFFVPSANAEPVEDWGQWRDDVVRYEIEPLLEEYFQDDSEKLESAVAALRSV